MARSARPRKSAQIAQDDQSLIIRKGGIDTDPAISSDETPYFLRWEVISDLSRSKIILGYQIALVGVPFINAITQKAITFGSAFNLPKEWLLSYFAALFFACAISIVHVACPSICRNGYNFKMFQDEGRNWQFILQNVRIVYIEISAHGSARANHFLKDILRPEGHVLNFSEIEPFMPAGDATHGKVDLWPLMAKANFNEAYEQDMFWTVQWFAGTIRPKLRKLAFAMLALGFLCVGSILVRQAWRAFSELVA